LFLKILIDLQFLKHHYYLQIRLNLMIRYFLKIHLNLMIHYFLKYL
jgi:hypothetical protein